MATTLTATTTTTTNHTRGINKAMVTRAILVTARRWRVRSYWQVRMR